VWRMEDWGPNGAGAKYRYERSQPRKPQAKKPLATAPKARRPVRGCHWHLVQTLHSDLVHTYIPLCKWLVSSRTQMSLSI
jgi:hypothetical protein